MTTTVSWSRQNPCNDVAFRRLPRTLSSLLVGVRFGAPQCVSGQKDAKDRQAAWNEMADFEKNSISGGDHSGPSQSGIGRAVHVKTTIARCVTLSCVSISGCKSRNRCASVVMPGNIMLWSYSSLFSRLLGCRLLRCYYNPPWNCRQRGMPAERRE